MRSPYSTRSTLSPEILRVPSIFIVDSGSNLRRRTIPNGETPNGLRFELDSTQFAKVWNQGWAARSDLAGRMVLGFGLASRDAVDRVYAELSGAGYAGLAPPHDAFWGARYAILEDPNGIAVGLMSPIDPARKAPPPAGWAD